MAGNNSCSVVSYLEEVKKLRNLRITTTISLSSKRYPSGQTTCLDQDGFPVCKPFKTLQAVLSWKPGLDRLCVATVPLRERDRVGAAPRTIICHDMMGGYLKDSYVQGHADPQDYYLYHWHYVDSFVYFSHNFVTIPPPTWTNAAHRNGCLSLGTIITEWQDGARLCSQLFESDDLVVKLAQRLVDMAEYYNFDGWLVNIENPIKPQQMEAVYTFLSLLHSGMHHKRPSSKVIWYDSILSTGELKWQNALNDHNRSFFELCDGIFLNYNWTELGLEASKVLAGDRYYDVYVGIDVFGRGCPGGGGYNSHVALDMIRKADLSAALFAPGWVYETQDKADFFQNQDHFWSLLAPFCKVSKIHGLPLVSSFGRGYGGGVTVDGKVVFSGVWNNLSAQDQVPNFDSDKMVKSDGQSAMKIDAVAVETSCAYYGGSSLKLQGSFKSNGIWRPALARLFHTNFSIIQEKPVLISYTYKAGLEGRIRHFLQFCTNGKPKVILLDPQRTAEGGSFCCGVQLSQLLPEMQGCGAAHSVMAALPEAQCSMLNELFKGGQWKLSNNAEWITRYFVVSLPQLLVERVDIACYPPETNSPDQSCSFELVVGEIKSHWGIHHAETS
eukprot:Em0022g688a